MKGIIVGAGEVGYHIADRLSLEGHGITVIEKDPDRERLLADKVDAAVIHGNGASAEVLEQAGIESADLFIAVTNQDEVNIVACLLANEFRVPRKIARVNSLEYTRDGGRLNAKKLGIDLLINPQSVVAEEIFRTVRYASATEVSEFAGARVVFLGYPVVDGSPLAGITLREVGDIKGLYRLVVAAIDRKGTTIIPRGEDTIGIGDIVYFVCNRDDLQAIRYLFGFEDIATKKVFVLGGGRVGFEVARMVRRAGGKVTLIEPDPDLCAEIADRLDDVLVLNAEGTDIDTLRAEGIQDADVFVAVSDDRTNILTSLLVKKHGTKRAIALVDHPALLALAPSLGVDATISPRLATAAAVLRYVRRGEVLQVSAVEQSDAEVLEMVVPAGSPHHGKRLTELHFPPGAIIGAIVRGEDVVIPGGGDVLMSGDHVIVFTLPQATAKVERFFS